MKHVLTTIATALALVSATAQTSVTNYVPGATATGVTYALPTTRIAVVLTLTRTHYTPGEFQRYARPYLRLNDVPEAEYDTWSLDSMSVMTYGVADRDKMYSVELKKRTVAPLVSLTPDGVLLSINKDVAQPQPLPKGSVVKMPYDNINPRDYMSEDILLAGSTMKMAELSANEILDIRNSRNELMKGQADFMPKDGEQLKLMLDNLDKQEEALLHLFKGSTTQEVHTVVVTYDPTRSVAEAGTRDVLCRISSRLGVVAPDDLSGAPIYVSVTDLKSLPEAVPTDPKTAKKQEEEDVRYCLPGLAQIRIFDAKSTFYEAKMLLAQLGRVEFLGGALFNKNTTTSVTFFPETGAIRKLETPDMQ